MSRAGKTIFIVDDDESVRRALARLVRSLGFSAEAFATAEDFLRAPAAPAPDCLLLDVHLPGLSGPQLRDRLAAEGRRVPVVFVTAYADDRTLALVSGAGAAPLLLKPFEGQTLLDAVGRALGC